MSRSHLTREEIKIVDPAPGKISDPGEENVVVERQQGGTDTAQPTSQAAADAKAASNSGAHPAALAKAETAVLGQVLTMPKGTGANNEARMLAWSRGMAAYKGKI